MFSRFRKRRAPAQEIERRAISRREAEAAFARAGGCCAVCDRDLRALDLVLRAEQKRMEGERFQEWQWELVRRELLLAAGYTGALSKIRAGRRLWELDHAHPLAEGGADTPENLRVLCLPCHREATKHGATRRAKWARLGKTNAALRAFLTGKHGG